MARAEDTELIDLFEEFYRNYYRNEIGELAQKYPNEQKSLYVDWQDLYRFDPDLADDFRNHPEQFQEYAEEALRLYDLPVDVKLGQAHVRVENLPESTDIRDIRADHRGMLISVQGIVRKATDVRPKVTTAAFECQRCGTLTRIPQADGDFQEPHECQGCERQGPFRINYDQSEFVDAQKLRIQESPEGLRGGETPQNIDVNIEDDITGNVTAGDHVRATGILKLDQQGQSGEKSPMFDVYMVGMTVEIEDEQFEDMDITDEDKKEIVALSEEEGIYEKMVDSIAPSIYGYRQAKLAMILQLFSGVTKHLPDESRIRGDLHMLLIGDPGTGKCQKFDTNVTLADGSEVQIGELVENHLDDPVPVDDGVYQPVDIGVQSVDEEGRIGQRSATKVWKREAPETMYRIRMASGSELEVTPSHPLFVQSDSDWVPRRADELSKGDFIATPDQLNSTDDDTLDVDYRRVTVPHANALDLPSVWTPALARLLGYIIGEGHVTDRDDSRAVTVTNADNEVIEDVIECLDTLGLRYSRRSHQTRDHVDVVVCSSTELVEFLKAVDPAIVEGSAQQRVPDQLFRTSDRIKANFLRSYIEGEGHVSTKEREITVASMSRELLDGTRSLLLALGISAVLEPRHNGSYRLRISGGNFVTYLDEVGFVTERKTSSAEAFEDVTRNTNTDVIPDIGSELQRIRERLALSQFEVGIPRTTYQHYERGDRNPSRESLQTVVERFEDRLSWLHDIRQQVVDGDWDAIERARSELGIPQQELADEMSVTQTAISYYERNDAVPDGGQVTEAKDIVRDRIDTALAVEEAVQALRNLAWSDIRWEKIDSIEAFTPDDDWVYDLEVPGTHNYLSNGIISHNSAMLQYIRNIAPRSVYTSGKGSSSAGLCVTGDTLIHAGDGFRQIRDVVETELPEPVRAETASEKSVPLQTFDRETGEMSERLSSQVWRMPPKPCRRIETSHGKELEASVNTPVLTCGENGIEWTEISDVEAGDYVAVPRYEDLDREPVPVREFLELTNEKIKLENESIDFLRERLCAEFGHLRAAAAELGFSEDFIYDSLSNRHIPLAKLDTILDGIDATRGDVSFERAMLRHGDSIRVPEQFDQDLMYLLGLVFGDGDISLNRRDGNRGMVRISNSDERLLERAADIFDAKFDKHPEIERQDDRVPCIRVSSATIARLFANAGMETPKADLRLDPKLTTAANADAFLRGFMDADGSVSARSGGGSSVLFSTISEQLARQVQLMLETYGVRARTRERDRRGEYKLEDGHVIESKHVQHFVELYGTDVERYAEAIGFESHEKQAALEQIVADATRRGERIPVGSALASVDGPAGQYYQNINRGDNPGRERARAMLDDRDLGDVAPLVEEAVEADLRWDEVVAAVDTGEKEVFDLTVPETHNFVGNGLVTHNTAAAVRDDFGEGQQWSLEAGALVLADQGIAAVDELDKMRCVTGETLVHLGDGHVSRIRDIAHEAAETGEIEQLPNGRTIRDVDFEAWTMTDDGRLVRRPVTAIHEYESPGDLTQVTLESGERLTSTHDHPYFVFEDGERIERSAADLEADDWVYVPRQIPSPAADGGVTVQPTETGSAGQGVSESLATVLGYLAGDGNIYYNRDEGSYGIRFTNAEEELLADFEAHCSAAFDTEPTRPPSEQRSDGVETVRVCGKSPADTVLDAGMNLETYDGKRLPDSVSESTREAKAAFVRALADSEGSVGERNLKIHSSSYELLLGTKQLLLEFGICSQIQEQEQDDGRDRYILAITAADSLETFARRIGFTLDRKQRALSDVLDTVTGGRTILDVIPGCGDLLEELRDSLRLHQSESGLDDATYCNFESEDANISLRAAQTVLDAFESRKQQAKTDLERLDEADWSTLEALRDQYHVSQRELAAESTYSQQQVSAHWGTCGDLREHVGNRLGEILTAIAETDLEPFRALVHGDVKWRRVADVETVQPDSDDDRIRLLRGDLADQLDCETRDAVECARTLLAHRPRVETWNELRSELDRHGVSFQDLATDLDVAGSTISRWFNGVVETDRFDDVRSVAEERIESIRAEVRSRLDEIEARTESSVYDLTVEGTHNFVANGMVVHNSEDRSAMHEALEQQSYHPNSEVLLADGRRVDIGEFVDRKMSARPDEVVDGVDCEILPVDDVGVHTVDFDSNDVTKTDVDRVSRHEAPEEFVRVTFSNGRDVLVTPEHPMFVDDDGEVGTVEARDIEDGSFVPAPRKLPNSAQPVELDPEVQQGKEKDVDLPDELSPDLAEILGLLIAEGHSYAGSAHEIGFSNQDERLLSRADKLMTRVFGMESTDTTNAAGMVTKRWVSTKLHRWFEANVPEFMHTARDRRIPATVLGASEEEIRRFLVGAFAGDGGVESEAMSFSTASEGLARDYADALSKIGVASRIHHDTAEDSWKVYVMGDSTEQFVEQVVSEPDERHEDARSFVERSNETPRHHDVLPTSAAREIRELRSLLGLRLTGKFRPHLDEGFGVQVETVEAELADLRERAETVRDGLQTADSLTEIREVVGWSGRELAERIDETPSTVHYAEDGGYDAARRVELATRARRVVESALAEFARRADRLSDRCDLRYYRVTDVETVSNEGEHACDWVYDVTVEPTNTFVSEGVVCHNSISVSKAGINATLKSRCSLLGAANPKYGRFDQYESIAEQIDLEPALISRFDLIFTVTDKPDEEEDRNLAEHILQTNYAGELHTHRVESSTSDYTEEEVERVTDEVAPTIEPDILRKYIAYAKRNVFPTMSEEAKTEIREFYVDLRAKGTDDDAPVPVTARKLEALVRLAEASARIRLSDTVEREDANRVIEIVRSCLEDIGLDPETGELDADVIETGTSKSQRDRIKNLKTLIGEIEEEYDEGAPVERVLERAEEAGMDRSKAEHEIDKLKTQGEVYEPKNDHLRTT
jgi:DNA replicative helicase MCM subunit Mcm2 (Cdc46/Mcm family)